MLVDEDRATEVLEVVREVASEDWLDVEGSRLVVELLESREDEEVVRLGVPADEADALALEVSVNELARRAVFATTPPTTTTRARAARTATVSRRPAAAVLMQSA